MVREYYFKNLKCMLTGLREFSLFGEGRMIIPITCRGRYTFKPIHNDTNLQIQMFLSCTRYATTDGLSMF